LAAKIYFPRRAFSLLPSPFPARREIFSAAAAATAAAVPVSGCGSAINEISRGDYCTHLSAPAAASLTLPLPPSDLSIGVPTLRRGKLRFSR